MSERERCPKCQMPEAHFVPPSFGEAGFYLCEVSADEADADREMGFPEGGDWGNK